MSEERLWCGRAGLIRLIAALAVVLFLVPRGSFVTPPRLLASGDLWQALTHPTTLDLQSAFQLVGTGRLPAGYPSAGRGEVVPTTLLEAVAWAESKWRQYDTAQKPLISADGGYGIMQVTSGMGPGGLPQTIQSAIANNVLYNVDYGAQLLLQKFRSTPAIGDGDPSVLEHWYYALWAYNAWGPANNPANPQFHQRRQS